MVACPALEELRQYLACDLAGGRDLAERVERHVEICRSCQDALERLTADGVPLGTTMPMLPGYRAYKLLGAGRFGEVWLAQDLNLPRVVAVKTLKMGADRGEHRLALEALRKDAALLTEVDHPNIVRTHAWLTTGDRHYLVMQYVSGGSLADLVDNEGPLDWQRAARYVADVGEGLIEVHRRGIVHRDVKPSNILWDTRKDEALLTDFGVGARLDDPAAVAGSIPFMAPEAFDGHVSPALDVYSLAATLFCLVTGSTPFAGPRISDFGAQIRRGLPEPDPRCTGIPEPLERLIRAGLAPDPERRPDLKDFVASLRGRLNQLMVDTLTMSKPRPEPIPVTEVATGIVPAHPGQPITEPATAPAPVELRLIVSRQALAGVYQPVATTHPLPPQGVVTRDMKKVPPAPDQVRLRTGDRVRVEVRIDQPGYLTVFNVGPSGTLNLLYPQGDPGQPATPSLLEPNQPLRIVDVEMTPPIGRERLFAVWSREPLALLLDELHSLVDSGSPAIPRSRAYVATRDMKRVQQSVRRLKPGDWHAAALELDHAD